MNSTASSARSRSASSNTITGFLPPKLEVHALQRAGPLRHDCAAGRRFADEADGLDVGMLGEGATGLFAEAMHGVEHAGGQARLVRDFREQRRGEGTPFRRLVDDRAAGRQRRRDLPGRQHERRIPRRDDADGSDRLADRVVELARRHQRQAVLRARRAVGEKAEVLRRPQRRLRHVANRLARIHALDERDLVGARFDGVGDLVQDLPALASARPAPARGTRASPPSPRGRCRRPCRARPWPARSCRPATATRTSCRRRRSALPSMKCATSPCRKRARCSSALAMF